MKETSMVRGSNSKSRKGTRPNDTKKPAVPGSGKNKPAKGYNQATKQWDTQSH